MTIYRNYFLSQKNVFLNNCLLLSNSKKNGLFVCPESNSNIIINIDDNGHSHLSKIIGNKIVYINETILLFFQKYLKTAETSSETFIKHLIIPEMEVERIFNTLRYKYLNAIYISKIKNPKKYMNSEYNKAFQSLAGLTIYQGNPVLRKTNDDFWREVNFTDEAKDQNWEKERHELQNILKILKIINKEKLARLYAELIAIKPGFHESYLHDDYFDKCTIPNGSSPRELVFRMLRGKGKLSSLKMRQLPPEINRRSYMSYAPCSITEGPFVFRKNMSVSYFDEIKLLKSKNQIDSLNDNFHILDFYNQNISSRAQLAKFLEKAKPFCRYLI